EVAGAQPAGVMHLGEEHLLGRPVQGTPLLEPPLQRTQLAVGETPRVAALQVAKQRLGLQAGVELEHRLQLGPDRGGRIRACAVVALHAFDLAGELAPTAVLAGRLGVHAGTQGGLLEGETIAVEAAELADLRIGDHEEPPVAGFPLVYACSPAGNPNYR